MSYDTTSRDKRRATEQAALRSLPRNISQKRRKALAACALSSVRLLIHQNQIYTLAALCAMALPEDARTAAKFALTAEALVKPREGKRGRRFVAAVVARKVWCVYTAR